jgi:hypothetical protein
MGVHPPLALSENGPEQKQNLVAQAKHGNQTLAARPCEQWRRKLDAQALYNMWMGDLPNQEYMCQLPIQ